MAKMRIHELAKELSIKSKDIIDFLKSKDIGDKSPSSNIEDDAIAMVKSKFSKGAEPKDSGATPPSAVTKAPAQESTPAADTPKEGAPKKKKNITAVFNSQYSSRARKKPGDDRDKPERRRPESAGGQRSNDNRRAFRPEGGHTVIKPRPENERTIRPRIKPSVPPRQEFPGAIPAPEKTAAKKPEPQVIADETQINETKPEAEVTAPKGVSPEVKPAADTSVSAQKEAAPVREFVDLEAVNAAQRPVKRDDKKPARDGGPKKDNRRDDKPQANNTQGGGKGGDQNKKKKGQRDGNNNAQGQGGRKKERPINLEKAAAKKRQKPQEQKTVQRSEDEILTLVLPENITIKELAEKMLVAPSEVVKKLFLKGVMVTLNQTISYEQAEEIALEYNCVCEPEEKVDVIAELLKEEEEDTSKMVKRPPVVCVMGHVDHGKTSLLDAIRDTHLIDKEAGGITQKIGAYMVSINGEKITFLDTPGHEAFTAMRMRGASSTDIAILVVAADDGVMPQTVEAINHARAAEVEIIVAINKIDKPGANIDRVKKELSEYDLISEDWGGSTVFVPVSAHTHEGIDELLEMILLTAEVLELKADPARNARGLVIEAELDKGRGVVATVLVQKGTLKVGDPIAAGEAYGKVRAMMDEHGRRIKKAGPSMPAEILGLSQVPNAGEIFMEMDSEKDARAFADTYVSVGKDKLIEDSRQKMSLDDLFNQIQEGNLKELNLILKADVQGSVEAVRHSLERLSGDEVVVKIIHAGVGAITESDVTLASASNAIIIGFNVREDGVAKQRAEEEGIDIRLYKVIYNIIEDIEAAMKGMLEPIYEEKVIGHAVVRQIFKASDIGNIAGSYVTDGYIERGCKVRISRREEQMFEGELSSLRRFKDNVKEVKAGFECGLVFEEFHGFEVDDEIEAYIMVEVAR